MRWVHVHFVHSGLDELTLYTLCYPAVTPAIVSSLTSSYPSYFGGVQDSRVYTELVRPDQNEQNARAPTA